MRVLTLALMLFLMSCRPDTYTGKIEGKSYVAEYTATGETSTPEKYVLLMDNGWLYETNYLYYDMLNSGDSIKIQDGHITILRFKRK